MATQTIKPKRKGEKPIKFHEGGLHESLGVPEGKKLTAADIARAKKMGGKAAKQVSFFENVLNHSK